MTRSTRRLLYVVLAGLFALLAPATTATAHSGLETSDPPANASLDAAPSVVVLTFTEPPDPELSLVHVLSRSGRPVETGPASAVAGQSKRLQVPLPADLPDGVYTVSWRVVSETDGHVTAGAFAFGVGVSAGSVQPPDATGSGTPAPSLGSVIGKIGLYAGLALLFASAVVGLIAFGGTVPARRRAAFTGAALASAGALIMLLAERATVGVSLGDLLTSSAGRDYVWLSVAVAIAGVLAIVVASTEGRRWLVPLGIAASGAMLVRALGGHADAATAPAVQVSLQWVHFMAVGIWIGGIALVMVLLRTATHDARPADEVRRFSRLAGYAVGVVLLTGVLRAANELGGLSSLFHPFDGSYQTTLTIKVAVVLGLVALGAVNRYRSIPRMQNGSGLLRRVLVVEVAGAIGVFALTGTLTGLQPQPSTAPPPPRPGITVTGSDFATTMEVSLAVTPGTAGPNDFVVRATDFDTGAPIDATRVSLRFEPVGRSGVGPSTLDLTRAGALWRNAGSQLSLDGVWNVTVVVETSTEGTEIPLTLATLLPHQSVTVSTAAGQPDLYTITLRTGQQIQAYNDPGTPGPNELHMTAFGADGNELPLASATMTAISSDGTAVPSDPRRFSPGHFVSDITLTTGDWTFFISATTRDGDDLVASFDQTI